MDTVTTTPVALAPAGRRPRWVAPALALLVIGAAALPAWVISRTDTDECHTADIAITYVADNDKLLNPWLITSTGPSLATYRGWSDQLHDYAARRGEPDIVNALRQIADLSTRAVTIVEQVRRQPAPDDIIFGHITAYDDVTHQLVGAEHPLLARCGFSPG